MTTRTRTRSLAGALLLSAVAVSASVLAPTSALADSSDCPSNYVCMWEDSTFHGSMYVRQADDIASYDIDGWDGDNEISSVFNNTIYCVRLFENDDWTGDSYVVPAGARLATLVDFDNEAESYTIYVC